MRLGGYALGNWVKVRTERGVEGWSFKRYLGQLEARK